MGVATIALLGPVAIDGDPAAPLLSHALRQTWGLRSIREKSHAKPAAVVGVSLVIPCRRE